MLCLCCALIVELAALYSSWLAMRSADFNRRVVASLVSDPDISLLGF